MKWLDDVLAEVPTDFSPEVSTLDETATKLGELPADMVPVARAWMYLQAKQREQVRTGLKDAFAALSDLMTMEESAFSRERAIEIMEATERLRRRSEALGALISAALWELFPDAEDSVGTLLGDEGWVVFTMPDNRPERGPVLVGIEIIERC